MLRKTAGVLRRVARAQLRRRQVRASATSLRPLRVVIGAGTTDFPGWLCTDQDILDITRPDSWAALFAPGTIDRILCEHVLEHLAESECRAALRLCASYLQPGGVLRVAVPDSYRDDEPYHEEAAPPRCGHRVFYNIDTLAPLLAEAGLEVRPLEYFDARGQFHSSPWNPEDGVVYRSARFDRRAEFRRGDVCYTSLLLDGRRPQGSVKLR